MLGGDKNEAPFYQYCTIQYCSKWSQTMQHMQQEFKQVHTCSRNESVMYTDKVGQCHIYEPPRDASNAAQWQDSWPNFCSHWRGVFVFHSFILNVQLCVLIGHCWWWMYTLKHNPPKWEVVLNGLKARLHCIQDEKPVLQQPCNRLDTRLLSLYLAKVNHHTIILPSPKLPDGKSDSFGWKGSL